MRCSRSRAIKSALRAASISVWLLIAVLAAAAHCRGVVLELFQRGRERRRRLMPSDLPRAREDQRGDHTIEKTDFPANCFLFEPVVIPEKRQ